MTETPITANKQDIAILVGLNSDVLPQNERSTDETLDELEALLETAGGTSVARVLQNRNSPDPRTFIGTGKAQEIKELCENESADLVVFDNELSPSQARALEDEIGVRVLDRAGLILDIFATRANTREGRLQVELAQYKYLLPRLTRMWTHLGRQAGTSAPIGTRGPGETQLETDRRHIRRKITKLEEELDEVRRTRATQRRARERNNVPVLALVGYTNSGKSTLLNLLSGAGIPARDRLFDTLDTTTRRIAVTDSMDALLSDTVGFIRKLPHHLVDAFRATLEELRYADVILHVIDSSNPLWREQAAVTDELIEQLECSETPRIEIFNKIDLNPSENLPRHDRAVEISAKTGEGIDKLLQLLGKILEESSVRATLRIPYDRAGLVEELYASKLAQTSRYEEDGVYVDCVLDAVSRGKYKEYVVS
ncbi:MAG: GTPase HflX [Oscillospiraceae bacterium]|nr:GTPase HflX [Oscillospiraceae bacterium]